ncbi:MAG: hypothetical protein RJQ21_10620, partial [Rhodospirillales bacterium]
MKQSLMERSVAGAVSRETTDTVLQAAARPLIITFRNSALIDAGVTPGTRAAAPGVYGPAACS